MKNFHVLCYISIIILGFFITTANSFFLPIDLVRIVLLMPATPVLNTPSYSWAIMLFSIWVLGLSAYIGYPRNPGLKPTRRRRPPFQRRRGRSVSYEDTHDYQYNAVFEMIAEMEPNHCFSRYLCHIATKNPTELTMFQKFFLDFVSPYENEYPHTNSTQLSAKKAYVDAVYFGKTTQCWNCCQNLYKTCDLSIDELILM